MGRLIDKDKLQKDYSYYCNHLERHVVDVDDIENMPTVDAEPIRHGHWIGIDDEPCEVFECDKCGYITEEIGCADNKPNNFNYCPNCGAKMEVEE